MVVRHPWTEGKLAGAVELTLFLAFGGTAALLNLFVGWLLYGVGLIPGLPYWCATAAGALSGLVLNFSLNYAFNFKFRGRSALSQFTTFCIVSFGGVVLTAALSVGLLSLWTGHVGPAVHIAGLSIDAKFAAHTAAVALVVLYSFPAHKNLSFNGGIRAWLQRASSQILARI